MRHGPREFRTGTRLLEPSRLCVRRDGQPTLNPVFGCQPPRIPIRRAPLMLVSDQVDIGLSIVGGLPRKHDGRCVIDDAGEAEIVFDHSECMNVRLCYEAKRPVSNPGFTAVFIRSDWWLAAAAALKRMEYWWIGSVESVLSNNKCRRSSSYQSST